MIAWWWTVIEFAVIYPFAVVYGKGRYRSGIIDGAMTYGVSPRAARFMAWRIVKGEVKVGPPWGEGQR